MTLRITLKPSFWIRVGLEITYGQLAGDRCFTSELKSFRSLFFIAPSNCSLLWAKIKQQNLAPRAKPEHLLWALLWLKLYATDEVLAGILGVDEDTFRERTFEMVRAIQGLKPFYVSYLHQSTFFLNPLVSHFVVLCRSNGRIGTKGTLALTSKQKCRSTEQIFSFN